MIKSSKNYLAVILISALLAISALAKPPALLVPDGAGTYNGVSELDKLLSDNISNNDTVIRQILGESQQDTLRDLYPLPFSDFFHNSTFAGFLGFKAGITTPLMNYSSSDQPIGLAGAADAEHPLKPVLINKPKF
jgi:hypothetical protein